MIRDVASPPPAAPPLGRILSGLRALAADGPLPLRVRGGCMAPVVREGERVEIVAARRYWPGDVVAFAAPDGRLLLHRVLGYRLLSGRLALVTRGDDCPTPDLPVLFDRILGRRHGPVPPGARLRAVRSWLRLAVRRLSPPFAR